MNSPFVRRAGAAAGEAAGDGRRRRSGDERIERLYATAIRPAGDHREELRWASSIRRVQTAPRRIATVKLAAAVRRPSLERYVQAVVARPTSLCTSIEMIPAPSANCRRLRRREMLCRCGMGFGALALADLMGQAGRALTPAMAAEGINPLLPKPPPLPAKAKRVIHLFMNGGPSHVDTFDPKPVLAKYAGKALPTPNLPTERKTGAAFPSPFKFQKYGQSGIEVSELFPHVGRAASTTSA